MLTREAAADLDAELEDLVADLLGLLLLVRVVDVVEHQRVQVAITRVEHVGGPQAMLVADCTDAGEDFGALAAKFPKPPASSGVIKKDGFFWLSEEAFLKDFAGDLEPSRARALFAVQGRGAPSATGEDGIKSLSVAISAAAAARTGAETPIDLTV